MTESELLDRLLSGDRQAFRALVERHQGMMLAFARSFLRDPAAAEEAVQETWVAVVEGLKNFERRSSLRTWIYAILANKARTAAARSRRTVLFADIADLAAPSAAPGPFRGDGHWAAAVDPWDEMTPERLLESSEIRRLLAGAIEALPEAQRAVLILRDVEGEDGATVAEMLQISDGNQRILLHRARARLREALAATLGKPQIGRV